MIHDGEKYPHVGQRLAVNWPFPVVASSVWRRAVYLDGKFPEVPHQTERPGYRYRIATRQKSSLEPVPNLDFCG
ncbi:MAG: hypothetical protein WCH61_11330, partial [bacterium]